VATSAASDLVGAALRGDTEAFAALIGPHRPRLAAFLRGLLESREEAEDAVQETLLRAYLGLSRLRRPDHVDGWLFGIAINVARMRLRSRAAHDRALASVAATSGAPSIEQLVEERELNSIVRGAIQVLPAAQREVVLLHYVDGLSCEEIGAILGRSAGAIRVRLHRARAQLRAELAPLAPTTTPRREGTMIELTLEDVLVRVAPGDPDRVAADQRVLLLREADGGRLLPIWVGAPEGNALAFHLRDEQTLRPLTSDLLAEVIRVTGARVEQVAITELREKTFYATIAVAVDGHTEELDARPSDAINLAVRVGTRIEVAEAVLDDAAFSDDDLPARLERDADGAGIELPEGEWRSLSAELLRALHQWPRR
jgi:RNA polymerase sigma factor (sigma-70 family)